MKGENIVYIKYETEKKKEIDYCLPVSRVCSLPFLSPKRESVARESDALKIKKYC